MRKAVLACSVQCFLLFAGRPAMADHYDRLTHNGGWDAYALPGDVPGVYVEGSAEGAGATSFKVGFSDEHPGTLYIREFLLSVSPEASAQLTLKVAFDNGDAFEFPASFHSLNATAVVRPDQVAPWLHDFTALHRMTASLVGADGSGIGGPQVFSLPGTTPTVEAVARYAADRRVRLPKPFQTADVSQPPLAASGQPSCRDIASPSDRVACYDRVGSGAPVPNAPVQRTAAPRTVPPGGSGNAEGAAPSPRGGFGVPDIPYLKGESTWDPHGYAKAMLQGKIPFSAVGSFTSFEEARLPTSSHVWMVSVLAEPARAQVSCFYDHFDERLVRMPTGTAVRISGNNVMPLDSALMLKGTAKCFRSSGRRAPRPRASRGWQPSAAE
ncbi:hypothetical protein [Paludibacterium sp.]|uniref:hypothetical protein n=1 Tax=Paludibacterium sp. TaxID=1917523 RepID=UPI0025FDC610|nr:hypothetical protein [Paludibacterium sp.]MBV8649676.1 hypothetical protein [Paludibacterium sp.]